MEDHNFRVALGLLLKSMQTDYEGNRFSNHKVVLTLGPTAQILVDAGLPQLPISMTGKVVDKCFYDHGLTKTMLEKTYHVLSTPRALYKSSDVKQPDSCVVMSYDLNKKGDPLIAAVHPNKQLGGRPEYHNNLATYFFKENDPETRWKKEGLLLWEAMP
jgi:hypothetical protein